MNDRRLIWYSSWPIVGPTDSVMRLMRGQSLTTEDIKADTSRSEVWTVSREQYELWQTRSPAARFIPTWRTTHEPRRHPPRPIGGQRMILPKRVRDKIEFRHSTSPDRTACWIWTGCTRNDDRHHDYPIVSDGGVGVPAHRYVYERLRKPIPEGKQLLPTCPSAACVNPNHMEIRKGDQ